MYDWTTTTRNAQFSRRPGRVLRAGTGNAPPIGGTAVLHADIPADETGPVIVSSVPVDNATGVSRTQPITITFDEDIGFGASGTITLRRNNAGSWIDHEVFDVATDQGTGAGQVSVGGAGDTALTIKPTSSLAATTEYAVRMSSGAIEDGRGNPAAAIADDTTLSFTTGSGLTLLDTLTGFGIGAGSVTVDLTSLGLQQDDLVRVFVATASNANRTIAITTSGYTALFSPKVDTPDTYRVSANVFEKAMGASPDANVVVTAPGSSNTVHIVIVKAYRGARLSPTTDVTPALKTQGTNGIVIDPPSNTPVTDGTIIEYWGCGSRIVGTADLYTSGDIADLVSDKHDSAGYTGVWCHGSRTWSTGGGTIDPAALTIAGSDATMSWACLSSTVSPA